VNRRKKIKRARLLAPMQLLIQLQWWSYWAMHLWQIGQWFYLSLVGRIHYMH